MNTVKQVINLTEEEPPVEYMGITFVCSIFWIVQKNLLLLPHSQKSPIFPPK